MATRSFRLFCAASEKYECSYYADVDSQTRTGTENSGYLCDGRDRWLVTQHPGQVHAMHKIEFEILDFHTLRKVEALLRSLRAKKGVSEATARLAATVTVSYDSNRISPVELEAGVLECREHCKGHFVIDHACAPTPE